MTAFEHDQHIPIDDLSAYADGEALSADERAEIEAHLAACETCREELESFRAISTLLADLPEPEAPRSFRLTEADVAPAAPPASPEPTPIVPWIVRRQSTFRVAAMAAALLLALVVTIDLLPDDTNEMAQDDADSPVSMMEEAEPESGDESESAAPDSGTMDADQEEADEEAAMDQEEEAAEESDDSGEVADDEPEQDTAMDQDEEAAEESEDSGDLADEESGAADGEESDDAPEAADEEQVESEEDGEVADAPDEDTAQEESEGVEEEALEAEDDAATDESATEEDVSQQEAAEPTEDEPAGDTAADLESDADRDGEPADEIAPADEPDDGISGLRILSIALAIVTVILLIAGFVIPRWWGSSAR